MDEKPAYPLRVTAKMMRKWSSLPQNVRRGEDREVPYDEYEEFEADAVKKMKAVAHYGLTDCFISVPRFTDDDAVKLFVARAEKRGFGVIVANNNTLLHISW